MKKLIDIIREMYPMTRKMSEVHSISLYNTLQEQQNLTEMLGTVNHKKVINMINKLPGVKQIDVSDNKTGGGKISPAIEVDIDDPVINIHHLNDKLETMGWYPAFIFFNNGEGNKYSRVEKYIRNYNNFRVRYEAKYDEQIDISGNSGLYHVTSDVHWNKIERLGLTPKSQGKLANHPSRIYLLQSYNMSEIIEIATQLIITYENNHLIKNAYILRIDPIKLKTHKFYEDPNYHMSQAVYTYQNIPPVAISVVQVIPVN